MKSPVARLYLVFTLMIALLLFPSSPARAEAVPELTSVRLMIDGREQFLDFSPDRLEYSITHHSSVPVEITVEAEAAAGYSLRIDNVPYAGGRGSATWSTDRDSIINLQVYYKTHQRLYLIHLFIEPQDAPAPGGGQEGGEAGDDGSSAGSGGQYSGSGGQNSGSGSEDSDSGGAPTDGGTPAPDGDGEADDPKPQPGADPEGEPHTTHLILYISAPFLLADETYIPADTAPYLVTDENGGGYTMVPVRFIAEALGADVSWDGTARKVGIDLDGRRFGLTIGELVPGTPVAAVIRDSRTFVPLRYVMESFGARVEWTQAERRIDIYYTPQPRPE